MNKIFKVIWNKAKHCYVVVSELTHANTKSSSISQIHYHTRTAALTMAVLLTLSGASADVYATVPGTEDTGYIESLCIGNQSVVGGPFGIAVGRWAKALGQQSSAFGEEVLATQYGSQAIGSGSTALGRGATAVGFQDFATAENSTSVGSWSHADGANASALGNSSYATAQNATAVGYNAKAQNVNSVALGAYSSTGNANPTSNATINGTTYGTFAGANPNSVVSVGRGGSERQITNVAAGRVTSSSTDAINGSQLYDVIVGQKLNYKAMGGANGQGSVTLQDGLNFKNGVYTEAKAAADGIVTYDAWKTTLQNTDNNVAITANENNWHRTETVNLKPVVTIGSNGTGSNPVTIDGQTGHITGLQNKTWDPNNYVTGQAATEDQLARAVADIDLKFDGTKGFGLKASDGKTGTSKLGGTVNVIGADTNISTTADNDNTLKIKLNNTLDLGSNGSVSMGDTTVNGNGITVQGGPALTKTNVSAGGNKITNVGNGEISPTSTDAINGSQLMQYVSTADLTYYANNDKTTKQTVTLSHGLDFTSDRNLLATVDKDGVVKYELQPVINVGAQHPVTVDGNNGIVSGLTNTTWDPNATYTGGQAATQEQLQGAANDLTTKGLKFQGDDAKTVSRKLGETLKIKGLATGDVATGNIKVVKNDTADDELNIELAKDITGISNITTNAVTLQQGNQYTTLKRDGDNITYTTKNGDTTVNKTVATTDDLWIPTIGVKNADGETASYTEVTPAKNNNTGENKVNFIAGPNVELTAKGNNITITAAGSGAERHITPTYSKTGEATVPTYTVDPDKKTLTLYYNNGSGVKLDDAQVDIDLSNLYVKGDASLPLKFKGNVKQVGNSSQEYSAALGTTVNVVGGADQTATSDGATYSGKNILTQTTTSGIGVMMKDDLDVNNINVNGTDGADGKIGLAGKDGTDGKDGNTIYIGAEKGDPGVDGKDGISRLVIEDKTGEHQVATLDDGINYTGDNKTTAYVKLDKDTNIYGGATSTASDDNINVTATQDGDNAKLKINLANDLKGLNSVTANTVNAGDVVTGGIKLGDTNNYADIAYGGDHITYTKNGDTNTTYKIATTKDEMHIAPTALTTTATGDQTVPEYKVVNNKVTLTYNDGDGNAIAGKSAVIDLSDLTKTLGDASQPLKFVGDTAGEVERKLGETLKIKGNATGNTADGNIKVVKAADDELDVELAADIAGVNTIESNTFKAGDTIVNKDGVTTPSIRLGDTNKYTDITYNGNTINYGNNTVQSAEGERHITPTAIEGKATGTEYTVDDKGTVTLTYSDGKGNPKNDEAVITGLASTQAIDKLKNAGLKIGAQSPTDTTKNPVTNVLGSTVNILGAGNKDDANYSGENLKTTVAQASDGTTSVNVLMDKDLAVDTLTAGKAGTEGKVTVVNADGTGATLQVKDGKDGSNGVDGSSVTRLVYTNPNTPNDKGHEVATMDDGLKFEGDDTLTVNRKLGTTLKVQGGAAADAETTTGNIKVVENGDADGLNIQLTQDVTGLTNLSTENLTLVAHNQLISTKVNYDPYQNRIQYTTDQDGNTITKTLATTDDIWTPTVTVKDAQGNVTSRTEVTPAVNADSTTNKDQNRVNFIAGDNVTITSTGDNNITIASTGGSGDTKGVVHYVKDGDTIDYNKVIMGDQLGDTYNTTNHSGGTQVTNIAYATGKDGGEAVNVDYLTNQLDSAKSAERHIRPTSSSMTGEQTQTSYKVSDNGQLTLYYNNGKGEQVDNTTDKVVIDLSPLKTTTPGTGSSTDYRLVGAKDETSDTYTGDYAVADDGSITLNVQDQVDKTKVDSVKITGVASKADLAKGLNVAANKGQQATDTNPANIQLGDTVNILGYDKTTGTVSYTDADDAKTYSDTNLKTTVSQDADKTTVHVLMSDTPVVDSVTANSVMLKDGDNYTTIKKDGDNITYTYKTTDPTTGTPTDTTKTVATTDDGMSYAGDYGTVYDINGVKTETKRNFTKKLNEQVSVLGGALRDDLTDGNIGVESDGASSLTVKLSKNLKDLTSITMNQEDEDGNVTGNSIIKRDGDSLTYQSINTDKDGMVTAVTNKTIATTDQLWTPTVEGTTDVTPAANADGESKKVNFKAGNGISIEGQGNNITIAATGTGGTGSTTLSFKGNQKDVDATKLSANDTYDAASGAIVNIVGGKDKTAIVTNAADSTKTSYSDKNILTQTTDEGIDILMKDDLNVNSVVVNGKNGTDGKDGIGIKGTDGTSYINIGKDGTNGVDGTDGKNGTDGLTRIIYTDPTGTTHDVATLDDGLKFKGDMGDTGYVKLNKQVNLSGGVTKADDLATGNNIGVTSKVVDEDGNETMNIQLAKDITGLNSVTTNSVKLGDTNPITVTNNGDDITYTTTGGVTKTVESKQDELHIKPTATTITGETATTENYKYDKATKTVTLQYNDGTGSTVDGTKAVIDFSDLAASGGSNTALTVNGGTKAPDSNGTYTTDGNLLLNKVTDSTGNDTYDIKLADDITAQTITATGKDGKDGKIGINGKDGTNGTNGNTIYVGAEKGDPGVDGKDGLSRLVIEDKTGEHQVATLDDGMRYGANSGGDSKNTVGNKLDSTVYVKGAGQKTDDHYKGDNLKTTIAQDSDGTTTINVLMDNDIKVDSVSTDKVTLNSGNNYSTVNYDGDRITYTKDGDTTKVYQVATTDDGISYQGDSGDGASIKLNKLTKVKGGATTVSSADNINVDASQVDNGANALLKINLAKDLKGLDSVTSNSVVTKNITLGDTNTTNLTYDGDRITYKNDGDTTAHQVATTADIWTPTVTVKDAQGNVTSRTEVTPAANTGSDTNKVNFIAGDNVTITGAGNDITISASGTITGDSTDKGAVHYVKDGDTFNYNKVIMGDSKTGTAYNATDKTGGTAVTNVSYAIADKTNSGYDGSAAVNVDLLNDSLNNVATKGKATLVTVNGGTAAPDDGTYTSDGNLLLKKTNTDGQLTYDLKLSDAVNVGGKDGQDGSIGVAGKDGKDGVSIYTVSHDGTDGKNGEEGHIGLTGPAGTDGKDGANADIRTEKGADGVDGKNGTDGMTRIIYNDGTDGKNGTDHTIATLDDGLKYTGDTGNAYVKLDKNTNIYGGSTTTASDDNINVTATQDGDNAKLKINLASDLKGLTSVATKNIKLGDTNPTTITYDGDRITYTNPTTSVTNEVATTADIWTPEVKNSNGTTEVTPANQKVQFIEGDNVKISADGNAITISASGTITGDSTDKGAVHYVKDGDTFNYNKVIMGDSKTGTAYNATDKTGGTAVTNVSYAIADKTNSGYDGSAAVNVDLLNDSLNNVATKGKATLVTVNGGTAAPDDGTYTSDGNLLLKKTNTDGQLTYDLKLSDAVTVGGKDGKDGEIGVAGKDGVNGVSIKGETGADGTVGHIGLTGPAGTNGTNGVDGKDGNIVDITVKNGVDGTPGAKGNDGAMGAHGVDGKAGDDGITRIVYEDKTGEHQVATMEDGLKFGANAPAATTGDNPVANKLNTTINIVGGGTEDNSQYSDGNIKTTVSQTAGDTTVDVMLAKDLKDLNSVTTKNVTTNNIKLGDTNPTTITYDGDRITYTNPTTSVTNEVATTADIWTPEVKNSNGTTEVTPANQKVQFIEGDNVKISASGNAITISAVDAGSGTTVGNIKFKGNQQGSATGDTYNATTGDTVNVVGGTDQTATKDGSTYSGKNILTQTNANGIGVMMKDDLNVNTIVINGKDGKDGTDGIGVKGADGTTYFSVGKDGTNGADGTDGLNGTDGVTRIIYKDPEDPTVVHDVATLDDGLKYTADTGNAYVKLDKDTKVYGGSTTTASDDNINVTASQDGDNALLKINLASDLKGLNSVATQTIRLGNSNTYTDITYAGDHITYTKNGDTNTTYKLATTADEYHILPTTYTVGSDGTVTLKYVDGNGNEVSGLTATITGLNQGGSGTTSGSKTAITVNGGTKAPDSNGTYTTDGNLLLNKTTGADGTDTYDLKLSDNFTVGKNGTDGKDGVDGYIGVDGKDGQSGVGIDGTDGISIKGADGKDGVTIKVDGKDGQIGLTGPAGKDGTSTEANIGVNAGPASLDPAKNLSDTEMTRLHYTDTKGDHQVATMDDGQKYMGDFGTVSSMKLNTQVNVVGGAKSQSDLTTGNIGVVSDGAGKLTVELNKDVDLGSNGSVKTGDTTINNDGMTVTNGPTITKTNVDMGGQQIHNVTAGTAGTDAVNVDQLNKSLENVVTNGKATLVTVNGGTTAPSDGTYTSGNLQLKETTTDGQLTYDLKLSDNMTIGGKNGTDGTNGKDGSIGVAGKDGTNGVNIYTETHDGTDGKDGAEGHIGLTGAKGTDGKDGASADIRTEKGADGVDGKNGTDGMTRIIYNDGTDGKNGTDHTVATLDDGIKYTADSGSAYVKLDQKTNIYGGATTTASDDNINVTASQDGDNAKLKINLAQDLKGLNSVTATTVNATTVNAGDTVINDNGVTINNGPTLTKDNISAGGQQIHDVAPGTSANDAATVGQLTDGINYLGNSINKLDNRMDKVGAGAAALAALHPLDFDPDDKWDFAAGYGSYSGASAVSVGAFYRPNEDTMFSVGGSFGNGENMVNAGVSLKLGRGNHVSTSRVAMAKEIIELRKELEGVKSLIVAGAQGKPLDLSKVQIFPDIPANHWAYDYVATLAGNGLLEGYPDGDFKGDRQVTRYEMAAVLYRAMLNGAKLSDRALKEFAPELNRIRVDTINKNADGTPDIQRVRVIKGRG